MQVCAVLRCATHAGLRSGAFSMFKSLGKKSVRCGAFSMFKHLWVRAQVWVAFQAIRCFQGGNQLCELHSRMVIVPVDLYMFGSTDCRPEWPTGNAWVVFDDNQVWATCWNGARGGMAVLSVMPPIVGWSGRTRTPGSSLMTTRCGLRVGMEVEVAWPFSR